MRKRDETTYTEKYMVSGYYDQTTTAQNRKIWNQVFDGIAEGLTEGETQRLEDVYSEPPKSSSLFSPTSARSACRNKGVPGKKIPT